MKYLSLLGALALFACSSPNNEPATTLPDEVEVIDTPAEEVVPESLVLINAIRAKGCVCGGQKMAPAEPLRWNVELLQAAIQHASNMDRMGFFSHTGASGSTPGSRAQEAGYDWRMIAENIAMGQPTTQAAIDSWVESPGHCRNLMNPDYREIGMANIGKHWVQVFGTR